MNHLLSVLAPSQAQEEYRNRSSIEQWLKEQEQELSEQLHGNFGRMQERPFALMGQVFLSGDIYTHRHTYAEHIRAFRRLILSQGFNWVDQTVSTDNRILYTVYAFREPIVVYRKSGAPFRPEAQVMDSPDAMAKAIAREGTWRHVDAFVREFIPPQEISGVAVGNELPAE